MDYLAFMKDVTKMHSNELAQEKEHCDLCGHVGSPLEGWHEHPHAIPSKILCRDCFENAAFFGRCEHCEDVLGRDQKDHEGFCSDECYRRYHKGSYHY